MALAMAREAKAPANEGGVRGGVVYASEQAHMSIGKAVALLGLGRENLRLIPVDDEFRMRTDLLENAILQDRAGGLLPMAIVASAGTVSTGAALADDPVEAFAFFEESLELSRRFRALRLWTSLHYHGMRAFREAIGRDLAHARQLAELIRAQPSLELLAPVSLSAVCFRRRFDVDPDRQNLELLRRVNQRGRVYLSNATIRGDFALRACFVNHRTTDADVRAIVEEVLAGGS